VDLELLTTLLHAPDHIISHPHQDPLHLDQASGILKHGQHCAPNSSTHLSRHSTARTQDLWPSISTARESPQPVLKNSPPPTSFTLPLTTRVGLLQYQLLSQDQPSQELQRDYQLQSARLESRRLVCLQEASSTPWMHPLINAQYDQQHHSLIDQVEQRLKKMPVSPSCTSPISGLSTSNPASQHTPPAPRKISRTGRRDRLGSVATKVMASWYEKNREHPYPSYETAEVIAKAGGATVEQVKKWFANKRRRESNTKTLTEIARRRKRCVDPFEDLDLEVKRRRE
jgi:transcriptional regulator with XRE-family HTH domain